MLNLDSLKAALELSNSVTEDLPHQRFDEIVSLIDREAYSEAAPLIENEFQEHRFDLRLTAYYLFGFFLEHGLSHLREIFHFLVLLINRYWDKMSPLENRDYQGRNSYLWFISRCIRHFEYINRVNKKKESQEFKKFYARVSPKSVEELLETCYQLNEACIQKWEEGNLNIKLRQLIKMIQGNITVEDPKLAPAAPVAPEQLPPKATEEAGPEPVAIPQDPYPYYLLMSEPMSLFFRKLEAFETLIQKREFRKAGLVADDIANTIENFNPLVYFPKLFVNHFLLLSANMQKLHEEIEDRDSIFRRTLEKLYHADLEIFIQWKEG